MKRQAIPPISTILKYLLISHKTRILALPCTPERSQIVTCVDVLLETEKEASHD